MAKPIVGSASELTGVLKDLFRQIDDGSITPFNLRAFVNHKNPFDYLVDIDWAKVYEILDMSVEYAEFIKTQKVSGDQSVWTVPVLKGVTPDKVVAGLHKLGVDVYLYINDLDKDVPTNGRDPNSGSYVVSFRRTVEADEENKNLSANQLKEAGHIGITLLERLLLELGYFSVTGKHLDEKNWTLCSGSRCSDGCVPRVDWGSDLRRVCVYWYGPGSSSDYLRSRSVVS
jgi:hypothetical protein